VAPPEGRGNAIFAVFLQAFWGRLLQSSGLSPCQYVVLVSDFLQSMLSDSAFKVNGYIRI